LVALYLVSSEEGAGKTTIGASLGRRWLGEGKKVGYISPVRVGKEQADSESEARFIQQVLALTEPVDSLCPPADKVKEAFASVSRGKDVVIVEAMCCQDSGESQSKASNGLAETLKARVIVVVDYSKQLPAGFISCGQGVGDNLLGIVLNKVPASQLNRVVEEITPSYEAAGVTVLGILPENRALFTLTVGELAASVQGEILNNAENSAELVENIMAGAMVVDSGLEYFGRKTNKAAVIRDDRPDMQMAALETSTRCLVISGGTAPVDIVRYKAADRGIPIVITGSDTDTVIKNIEEALDRARFNQEKKLLKLAEVVEPHLNFSAIDKGLGLG